MKPKIIIGGAAMLFVSFVLLPRLMIYLNGAYNLPVYVNPVLKAIGFLLIILAAVIFLWSVNLFRVVGHGTPAPMEPPKELVAEGIYKYSRNPIFISYLLVWLAQYFIFGQAMLLALTFIMAVLLHLIILHEEKVLQKRFGQSYIDYCKRVRRWV